MAAIGLDGHRLITKYPLADGESPWLFAESDTHQNQDLAPNHPEKVEELKEILDALIKLSDYSLEKGF